MMMSMMVFQQTLPIGMQEELIKTHMPNKKQKGRGGYWWLPFSRSKGPGDTVS